MRLMGVVITASMFTAAAPAAAERWYAVGGNAQSWGYVDTDSVEARGDLRYATSYTRYAQPLLDEVHAGTITAEFDCANHWFRTLEYNYYGARREHIGTEVSETIDQRRRPEPGTINAAIFEFVCFGGGDPEPVVDPWDHAGRMFGAPPGK